MEKQSYTTEVKNNAKKLLKSYEDKRTQCESYQGNKKKLCRDKFVLDGKIASINFLNSKLNGCDREKNPNTCKKSIKSTIDRYAKKRDEYKKRVECFNTDDPIGCRKKIIADVKKELNEKLSIYIDKKIDQYIKNLILEDISDVFFKYEYNL